MESGKKKAESARIQLVMAVTTDPGLTTDSHFTLLFWLDLFHFQ